MMRHRGSGSYPKQDYYGNSTGGGSGGGYGGNTSGASYGGYDPGSGGGGGEHNNTMYGGSSSSKNSKKNKQNLNPTMLLWASVGTGLWAFLMMGLWWNASGSYKEMLTMMNVQKGKDVLLLVEDLKEETAETKVKTEQENMAYELKKGVDLGKLEKEKRYLQKERDELRVKYEGPDKKEEESRVLLRDQAFKEQLELLQQSIKKESKRTVLERFGPGPHKVQFTFEVQEKEYDFILQLAPLDAVPHAVHLFLEQVAHGLWNHTYFYLNGPHVIQVGPQLFDEDYDEAGELLAGGEDAAQKFETLGLSELSFPDYSEDYPHVPWTVGFTGRPGGPDFYINKVDNTKGHGPGGQYQHAIEEQGDSCFGKIIEGRQHLATVFQQSIYNDNTDWHFYLEEPIEITKAFVVTVMKEETPQVEAVSHEQQQDDNITKINEKLKRKPRIHKTTVEP